MPQANLNPALENFLFRGNFLRAGWLRAFLPTWSCCSSDGDGDGGEMVISSALPSSCSISLSSSSVVGSS